MGAGCSSPGSDSVGPVTFVYWPLQAKGLAVILALEYSGASYKVEMPATDPDMSKQFEAFVAKYKTTAPFSHLPILKVDGMPDMGHEIAILNFIGSRDPAMSGSTALEVAVVQQLLQESEDIYQKLSKMQPSVVQADKGFDKERLDKLWTDTDKSAHSGESGLKVHLGNLENLMTKSGQSNKYTESGRSVGEMKLWSMLHQMMNCDNSILNDFKGLKAFYDTMLAKEQTKKILNGDGLPLPLQPYYVAHARASATTGPI